MHSQQLLTEIKANLYTDPQKCIKLLSTKNFLNNLFNEQLTHLVNLLEGALQKASKDGNKNISFSAESTESKISGQLNPQLIITFYSIIIMKSTCKSIVASEQSPIFNSKLAVQTLNKLHRQVHQEEIRKIIASLLLKIPTFSTHKTIVKDLDPKFVSKRTLQKASSSFQQQCPNLYEEKLLAYKNTEWAHFLSFKPFKLDILAETIKKLQIVDGTSSNDGNNLVSIRDELKKEANFLLRRIQMINKQEFFLYEFCDLFSTLYRTKLTFSQHKKITTHDNKSSQGKPLSSYSINELRLKILLQAKNQLLQILIALIKKLSSYWTRKLKWLYEFIVQRIQIYGLQEMGLSNIQQPDVYIQKLTQLKLLIKLSHTYFKQFGPGLFPEQKLKSILFTQQYSFYKLIEAILYNEYQFQWKSDSSRILNYQKIKKVSEESKQKKSLIKTINVNSKSLNINPHYDLVLQKVVQEITFKNGTAYQNLRELICECLKFFATYYRIGQGYCYGGNLISMVQNCKNIQILDKRINELIKQIKEVLYPPKRMVKQGLEFFCEEVFETYISKRRLTEVQEKKKNTSNFSICKTAFLTLNSKSSEQVHERKGQQSEEQNKQPIRKTKSYEMMVEGWGQDENLNESKTLKNLDEKVQRNPEGQIFYSIKEGSSQANPMGASKFESIQENNSVVGQDQNNQEDNILLPDF